MTKRCIDCGIIFQTDDPEQERCELCECEQQRQLQQQQRFER